MQLAADFVKLQAEAITKELTKEHHNVLRSFLDFKRRTDYIIEERDELREKWSICERALALKAPVREADFALDDESALSLYDCLVPMLKQHRKFKVLRDAQVSIEDYRTQ